MKRTLVLDIASMIGQRVRLVGWVDSRRDHGKLIFMDIRDRTGSVQAVVIPDQLDAYNTAKNVQNKYVIEVEGLVKRRPGAQAENDPAIGKVEIEADLISIISRTADEPRKS